MFCIRCGARLNDGAKYCSECGLEVGENRGNSRQQAYVGEIRRCHNCGEVLRAIEAVCNSCGYELRGNNVSSTVKEFERRLEEIGASNQKESKKIDLQKAFIRNFPIPNTKEDLFEFIVLASSNLDSNDDFTGAWRAKFEQAYQKAKLTFGNEPNFGMIEDIYFKRKSHEKHNIIWGVICALGVVVLIGMMFGLAYAEDYADSKAERDLNKIVEQIQEDIKNEDYNSALIKANKLRYVVSDSKEKAEKWDEQREYLINMIEKLMEEEE